MRDLYFLFEKEDLTSPTKVEEWIDADKKPITAMGDFKPLAVLHKDSDDVNLQNVFDNFFSLLEPEEALKVKQKNGYFVVAKYNEEKHQRYERQ